MNSKIRVKGILSLIFMTLSYFMMVDTKYNKALGDYVLEFLGLRAWSNNDTGTHLTVIYFGVLFLIGIYLVIVNVCEGWNKRKREVLVYSVILITIYYLIISTTFVLIKSNSDGLLTIGLENSKDSYFKFSSKEQHKIDEFNIKFTLKNYDNKEKSFSIQLVNDYLEENNSEIFTIHAKDGDIAIFNLSPKETKEFILTSYNYDLKEKFINGIDVISFRGSIKKIILSDNYGNKVYLDSKNFFGKYVNQ